MLDRIALPDNAVGDGEIGERHVGGKLCGGDRGLGDADEEGHAPAVDEAEQQLVDDDGGHEGRDQIGGDGLARRPALALQLEHQIKARKAERADIDRHRPAQVDAVGQPAAHDAGHGRRRLRGRSQPADLAVGQAEIDGEVGLQAAREGHGRDGQKAEQQAGKGQTRSQQGLQGLSQEGEDLLPGGSHAGRRMRLARGLAHGQHDQAHHGRDDQRQHDDAGLEADPAHQQQGPATAQQDPERLAAEHHAAGEGALVLLQRRHREGVNRHVLHRAAKVVHNEQGREQTELGGQVKAGQRQQGDHHHGLGAEDPAAARAQPLGSDQVDEGAISPFEGPGQQHEAEEGADLGRARALAAQLGRDRRHREADGQALRQIHQEEGGDAPLAGCQQIVQSHSSSGSGSERF